EALATVTALPRDFGWFLMLLAVEPSKQGQGLGPDILQRVLALHHSQLVAATVEVDNYRSVRACAAAGLKSRGPPEALNIVRLHPRCDARLCRARAQDIDDAMTSLGRHAAAVEANAAECWVWDDGGVRAFVQAVPHRWTITGLGGSGFLLLPA